MSREKATERTQKEHRKTITDKTKRPLAAALRAAGWNEHRKCKQLVNLRLFAFVALVPSERPPKTGGKAGTASGR
jgi:hypothetical protein